MTHVGCGFGQLFKVKGVPSAVEWFGTSWPGNAIQYALSAHPLMVCGREALVTLGHYTGWTFIRACGVTQPGQVSHACSSSLLQSIKTALQAYGSTA